MIITELKSVTSIENRKTDKPMGMDTLTLLCRGITLYCSNSTVPAGLYADGLVRC